MHIVSRSTPLLKYRVLNFLHINIDLVLSIKLQFIHPFCLVSRILSMKDETKIISLNLLGSSLLSSQFLGRFNIMEQSSYGPRINLNNYSTETTSSDFCNIRPATTS